MWGAIIFPNRRCYEQWQQWWWCSFDMPKNCGYDRYLFFIVRPFSIKKGHKPGEPTNQKSKKKKNKMRIVETEGQFGIFFFFLVLRWRFTPLVTYQMHTCVRFYTPQPPMTLRATADLPPMQNKLKKNNRKIKWKKRKKGTNRKKSELENRLVAKNGVAKAILNRMSCRHCHRHTHIYSQ